MNCKKCHAEIENDDNFCWKCGHYTDIGYSFFKGGTQNLELLNGSVVKKKDHMEVLITLMMLGFALFFIMISISGKSMFKPIFYIKKQILAYKYGYNVSLIKTDNTYNKIDINTIDDAYYIINQDISSQEWQCQKNWDRWFIEQNIMKDYGIKSISFCDISLEETKKIEETIRKIYDLFPNINGYLTNITITNATTSSDYIAYFQAINQFVNSSEDIKLYNRVNKTQILLNSYYFLNEEKLKTNIENEVGDKWYVKDATWESTIAHEFGHYITFVALLRSNDLDNIVFITQKNINEINSIITIENSGSFADEIVSIAYEKYKVDNDDDISIQDFAMQISEYACTQNESGNLLSEETIAEAVHDYYLHENNASKSSIEIINVLKEKLQ